MLTNTMSSATQLEENREIPWTSDVFVFPTTIAQQGFWFLDQIDPGNPAYNIAVRFTLTGPLNRPAFERAVQELVERHEILRTRVEESDGAPVQVVTPNLELKVGLQDISHIPKERRLEHSEFLAITEAGARFDLGAGPLLRVNLLRLDEREHVLLITIHHIIADGWSIGIIAQELGTLYQSASNNEEPQLAPLPLQFGDFAVWQNAWLESQDFHEQLRFWKKTLAGLPLLEVPTDRERPKLQTSNGYIQSILLPTSLTDRLDAICRAERVTLFMLTLAAWKLVIKHETRSNDVYVGTVVGGRSPVEIEPLIGPFINPLVLRTIIPEDCSFLDFVATVKKTVLDAFEHGDLPFELLVKEIQPRHDMSRHAVFQINFIFQRDFVKPFEAAGLTLKAIPSKSPGAIYDLNFFMVERADGWRSSCEYNTDLYDASTIHRLLHHHKAILEAIAHDPTARISKLASASAAAVESSVATSQALPSSRKVAPRLNASLSQAATSDEIEEQLLKLWRHLLGVAEIGLNDDFFDVGGHSLLALKLLASIEKTMGQRLSLSCFLHAPTISALAARLRDERSRSRRDRVSILNPEGTKASLVLVDTGPYYRPLIRHLGPDQPVLGLVLPELQELPLRFQVRDIAANLIETLRDAQPEGPYYLCGWCHAGIIAFEMAQQMIGQGEDVPAVILFDADNPNYVRRLKTFRALPIRACFFVQKIVYHLDRLRRRNVKEMLRYAAARFQTVAEEFQRRLWGLFYRTAANYDYEHLKTSSWFQFLAVTEYRPEPLETTLVLFRSHDLQTGWFRDPHLGWDEVAEWDLIVHEMEGNHAAMLNEPGVTTLAEKLAELIPHNRTA